MERNKLVSHYKNIFIYAVVEIATRSQINQTYETQD
jgi:hypothetical protein